MATDFDLTPQLDDPMHAYGIVHIHNKSSTYHIMRQVLLDSSILQDTYCFFYNILTKSTNDFNTLYSSVAFVVPRNEFEVDIYMNVDEPALAHVIKYIQCNKIDYPKIVLDKSAIQLIDLATIFGLTNLVSLLRQSAENHEIRTKEFHSLIKSSLNFLTTDSDVSSRLVDIFLRENTQQLSALLMKLNSQENKLFLKVFLLFVLSDSDKISNQ